MARTVTGTIDNILEKLHEESGFESFWHREEIHVWWNDLYVDVARRGKFFVKRTVDLSEADVDYYPMPSQTIEIYDIIYDDETLIPTTVKELDEYSSNWRTDGSGTPIHWYIRKDERYTRFRLYPTPSADDETIEIYSYYYPSELRDNGVDAPMQPFADNKVLEYGVLAQALWQAGPGRDMERGNYYWSMFDQALKSIFNEKNDKVDRNHVLRSIHDNCGSSGIGLNGYNNARYPRYNF